MAAMQRELFMKTGQHTPLHCKPIEFCFTGNRAGRPNRATTEIGKNNYGNYLRNVNAKLFNLKDSIHTEKIISEERVTRSSAPQTHRDEPLTHPSRSPGTARERPLRRGSRAFCTATGRRRCIPSFSRRLRVRHALDPRVGRLAVEFQRL